MDKKYPSSDKIKYYIGGIEYIVNYSDETVKVGEKVVEITDVIAAFVVSCPTLEFETPDWTADDDFTE